MNQSAAIYAGSLYSLAAEERLVAQILDEMDTVQGILESEPDFVALLASPGISKEERTGMLDTCLRGKIHPYLLNFLKLITERGMICQLEACCAAYQKLYNEEMGILPVSVASAVPLDDRQKVRLKEKLDKITGKDVQLCCAVDPQCIGGIRVDYDNKQIDGTVANRLSSMAELLKNTAF
ncbi:MAG: ATP synthase F1 subunit delta [Ruminococcaceae bacterium]|nr:ATP synthase F1 subunit delta [Oscillospiraceae bacterium]